jgi:signal transduction histidine kinase
MRWWLALAFAAIAALTSIAVAEVFRERSSKALRAHARDLAVGQAVSASDAISNAYKKNSLDRAMPTIADKRNLSLFVFDTDGKLVTSETSHHVDLKVIPYRDAAVNAALNNKRFVISTDQPRPAIIAALPIDEGVVLAYAVRPDIVAELGIVRDKIVEAALWATALAILVGIVVATLIAARLRGIANAAAAIESGSFDVALRPRFRDELGELALTIDRMRERLRHSFTALEAERDRLRQLLRRLQEGVVAIDPQLRLVFVNDRAAQLLGPAVGEEGAELGEAWPQLLSLRELARGLFIQGAGIQQRQVQVDEERAFALVGIPAGPESDLALLVVTDLSERQRRERVEREFVANAAHELRTPLATISGAVEVLQAGAKEDVETRDRFLAHIEREAKRLGRLTQALLVLARAQTGEEPPRLVPVELRPLIEDVMSGLTSGERTVKIDCPDSLLVLAERDLAAQALANVAGNALKHANNGAVTIRARPRRGGGVTVEVSDQGPGISARMRERIFDRFYRPEHGTDGFGLGLAIAREAVSAIGGQISIESEPGRGTTVRFVLQEAKVEAALT